MGVKDLRSQLWLGLIPGRGTSISLGSSQKKKKKIDHMVFTDSFCWDKELCPYIQNIKHGKEFLVCY